MANKKFYITDEFSRLTNEREEKQKQKQIRNYKIINSKNTQYRGSAVVIKN